MTTTRQIARSDIASLLLGPYNVKDYGAVGNGVADDTAAIQAALNAGVAAGHSVFAPAGNYKISSHLLIGASSAPDNLGGFEFFGEGAGTPGLTGGTNIIYYGGTNANGVITCGLKFYRYCAIRHMSLSSNTHGAMTYGVLFNDSKISGAVVENVQVRFTDIAFGQLVGTGVNGEFFNFYKCGGETVDKYWYSNAGQGYVHAFYDCGADLNPGGTYFHQDFPSGGGGLDVFNFNSTGLHTGLPVGSAVTNTTLLQATNTSSCINFVGGRIEWLTRLLYNPSSSWGLAIAPKFSGLQLTVDNDLGSGFNTLGYFIDDVSHADQITIENCSFDGVSGTESLNVRSTGYPVPCVDWRGCIFGTMPKSPSSLAGNQKFTLCTYLPTWSLS